MRDFKLHPQLLGLARTPFVRTRSGQEPHVRKAPCELPSTLRIVGNVNDGQRILYKGHTMAPTTKHQHVRRFEIPLFGAPVYPPTFWALLVLRCLFGFLHGRPGTCTRSHDRKYDPSVLQLAKL